MDEAMTLVRSAVPADGACLSTVDPSTLTLAVAHRHDLDDSGGLDFFFYEYAVPDVAQFVDLSRRNSSIAILFDETKGDLQRSDRFRNVIRPLIGAEHELRGVARRGGTAWGAFALYRTHGGPGFDSDEADFLHTLEGVLADGIRAAIVTSTIDAPGATDGGPAILLFDLDGKLIDTTESGAVMLSRLDDPDYPIPGSVAAVLLRIRRGDDPAPTMRTQDRSGRWLLLRGTRLRDGSGATTTYAVTIEPAGPADIAPLLMSAYGLTPRETAIVQAMTRGDSTQAIARALHLSPYTVQDHFKSVFTKLGVSSRREVTSRLFFLLYADADLD
ncbi:LuxR C-terminal-related transcriptional regulator [Microbacterium sediminicola]|uniref:LuxR C-terminal-related transcriptional regulator n=2 Tax=Microbacterium sediminicola TaxID=415210 RepID=A0ABP4U9I6_9MICO